MHRAILALGLALTASACAYRPTATELIRINDSPADMRSYQSTGPVDLAPGGSFSLVVAYIFASAVAPGVY